MEIVHVYQRKRREFGRQCLFSDRPAQLIVDLFPDETLRDQFLVRDPAEASIQNAKEFSEHEVWQSATRDATLSLSEGFWPLGSSPFTGSKSWEL